MKFRDLTELAWRNLREALLRNSLTTLGIGVGVASLVAMLSLGVGLQEMANQRLSRSGLFDAIIVAPRTNFRGFGRWRSGWRASSRSLRARSMTQRERRSSDCPTSSRSIRRFASPPKSAIGGNPYSTVVAGVPESGPAQRRLRRHERQLSFQVPPRTKLFSRSNLPASFRRRPIR